MWYSSGRRSWSRFQLSRSSSEPGLGHSVVMADHTPRFVVHSVSSSVQVGTVAFGPSHPLGLILGPCGLESRKMALEVAHSVSQIGRDLGVAVVFKGSFDKANRTSGGSWRGPGLEEGLRILEAVRSETGLPVTTDVHLPSQAAVVAEVVDLLQVPAFLCRQTDLIRACAATGLPVNLKKGQFMAPETMSYAVEKASGAAGVLVTERGTSFGYGDLVVDFRGFSAMQAIGVPVVFDATHAVQRPSALGGRSGGDRALVRVMGRAAVAAGVDAIFAEVHPDPDRALSDPATQLPLSTLAAHVSDWLRVAEITSRGTP
jgi:2-dehydro-3-deoxyphosphooctonate aldolase (KDO 8-P synthase)